VGGSPIPNNAVRRARLNPTTTSSPTRTTGVVITPQFLQFLHGRRVFHNISFHVGNAVLGKEPFHPVAEESTFLGVENDLLFRHGTPYRRIRMVQSVSVPSTLRSSSPRARTAMGISSREAG